MKIKIDVINLLGSSSKEAIFMPVTPEIFNFSTWLLDREKKEASVPEKHADRNKRRKKIRTRVKNIMSNLKIQWRKK